ncbi:MAG: hypothetical protein HZA14_08725 [Nitrospirae bacterium]|nr:hypothetical protein [Nitrospirota bacterium]
MKKTLTIVSCLLLISAFYLVNTAVNSKTPTAVATLPEAKIYTGKIYVAGMGGHFAQADIVIDPSSDNPITLKDLDRVELGSKETHPLHDIRIDANDRNKMYWATYKTDKKMEGKTVHMGIVDLKEEKVIKDQTIQLPDRAQWIGALYCSSGQSRNSYMPVTMANDGFMEIVDKNSLEIKRRIFFDSLGYKNNYQFFHGTNSPDMKTFIFTANLTEEWAKPDAPATRLGKVDVLQLDLAALENGEIKVLGKNVLTGSEKTVTFRQRFTPDGKLLLQSGADRFFLLNGSDLKLLDEEMMTEGENHDALPTPDGKYAILTLRSKIPVPGDTEGKKITDGVLQLYDIETKKVVGKPTSTCFACHKDVIDEKKPAWDAILCGLEANWN